MKMKETTDSRQVSRPTPTIILVWVNQLLDFPRQCPMPNEEAILGLPLPNSVFYQLCYPGPELHKTPIK